MFLVLFALDIPSDSDYLVIRLPVTQFKRGASMAEKTPEDLTTQILIQIRDEMRAMHSSFDARFVALEKRMGSVEARFDALEKRMGSLEARMDSLEARMDSLEARMDSLGARIDTLEARTEARFKEVFRRLEQLGSDLKKFASVVNETILHYADEMDTVRDRLSVIENKIGIVFPPE